MTNTVFNILQRKLSAFVDDGRQAFYDEIGREVGKVASRGFSMPTGNLRYRIVELSAERVRNVSKIGLDVANELNEKHVLIIDSRSKQAIIEAIMSEVSKESDKLKQFAKNRLPNAAPPGGGNPLNIITEAVARAYNEIEIELDILINSKKKNEVNSVFNVYNYGNANAIQAGQNNIINQIVTADMSEKAEKLTSSITQLLQQLKLHSADTLSTGLTSSIEETLIELHRPETEINMFKVQSVLMMTMTTLQTLPALKPAVTALVTAYDYYFGTNVSTMFN